MAGNPYAAYNTANDPYTNGNNYGAAESTPTDDYDPYGDRYGTPPVPAARDARRAARTGGYGGFVEDNVISTPLARSEQPSRQDGLGSQADELPTPMRSPRRPAAMNGDTVRSYRSQRSQGSIDGGSRTAPTYGRPQDRLAPNGNGLTDEYMSTSAPRIRNNGVYSGGDGTRQIEEVLQHIQTEWSFMSQDKCVPVQVALQLMDSSSLGRAHQYEQFQSTHKQLQRALKAIVNEHHQGFNSSIGTFHKIQGCIHTSQTRLRALKESLGQSKIGLSTTRPELKGLASTSQSYDEMLQMLSQIEQLRLVPDKLEARISEKRFLTAVDVLQDALRIMRKPEMDNIGALSDLRTYLTQQETSLTDILIEELHSHLYLKSPYCQDRWKAHAKEQSNGASSQSKDIDTASIQPLYVFLENCDVAIPMAEDSARNPEVDSFYYIQVLVESLNKMGHLDVAVTAIEQRMPVELFRVVDKTNNEVDQRHPTALRGTPKHGKAKPALDIGDNDIRSVVIYDLLWTLYSKFEAIAEGHRVFHDVVTGITQREDTRNADALTGTFKELWMLYQNEIRSLLHDYLASDSNMYRMSQSIDPNADIFRRGPRKKDKQIFSLSGADKKAVEITTELDDLEAILKASVPGLVSESRREVGEASEEKAQKTEGAATGHKLLIEPSVFNMGLLLPPSLAFLNRLKDIVPPARDIKTSTLTSFLDDFLVNVFLPQLDETLVKLSSQVFEDSNAFQEDPQWSHVASHPIFRGSVSFFNLIMAFCRMLNTIPHDQAFSQLIITQMVTYYDKCYNWYKGLVSSNSNSSFHGGSLKTSALIAEGPGDIHDTIKKLWTAEEADKDLLNKEIGLLLLQTNEVPLGPADIIPDRRTVGALCLLYTSMRWLASKIEQLRSITKHDVDSSRRSMQRAPNQRWSLLSATSKVPDKSSVYLPMTQETVVAFDSVVSSYQELAGTVILTLHMELRTQIIHSLTLALSPSTAPYVLEQNVNDPDPRILSLNADIVAYDSTVSHFLPQRETDYVRTGLGLVIDTFLVTNASHVKAMNVNGCGRMQLNILVLQQNLKNFERDVSLKRAARYYDLFSEGPDAIVELAKQAKEDGDGGSKEKYTYDELKTLLELCFSEKMADHERGVSTVARRSMGDKLLQLSEVMWQS